MRVNSQRTQLVSRLAQASSYAVFGLVGLLFISNAASAASTAFRGPIELVFEDNGANRYTGATQGTIFQGQLNFGDFAGQAFDIIIEPNESGFEFLGFPVSLSQGGANRITGGESFVTIQDNFALDEDEADLASLLLGTVVTPGTLADAWSASGLQAGAFEADPDPFDGDDTELVFNGILFEVTYFSLNTNLINGLDYDPTPPGLNEVDGAIYTIVQGDSQGTVLFEALGFIETTEIPIPAAAWLFGSALGLLGFVRKRIC